MDISYRTKIRNLMESFKEYISETLNKLDENYRIKPKDWVPYRGFEGYLDRNDLTEDTLPRIKILLAYHLIVGTPLAAIEAGKNKLEKMLKNNRQSEINKNPEELT